MLTLFVDSGREGISPGTIEFYQSCLTPFVKNYPITSEGISSFLGSLRCGNAKLNYYRAITVFVHWLIRAGKLNSNPLVGVDRPKASRRLLSALTGEEMEYLANQTNNLRDRLIVSLLGDSGMKLSELASIKASDIDWGNCTITIVGKGNKQRRAPFTEGTAKLLREWLSGDGYGNGNIWNMGRYGIQTMLKRLAKETGIACNAHSFRRGFACNLHRRGLSTLDIMHLGGWEDLDMVLKYTRSITFEDCLEHYKKVTG